MQETTRVYAGALSRICERYSLGMISVLPVPPPVNPKYESRRQIVDLWHKAMAAHLQESRKVVLLDYYEDLKGDDGFLKLSFNCDGTHLNCEVLRFVSRHFPKFSTGEPSNG